MILMNSGKTFVLGEIEVRQTGRQAARSIGHGKREMVLVEVTPVDENDGTWRKWVPPESLFTIKPVGE